MTDCIHKALQEEAIMRAACLILLVVLTLQVTSLSIHPESIISDCCGVKLNNYLKSKNIKSYIRTNEKACKNKAFIVQLKNGNKICANATSKNILSAIEQFDKRK